MRHARWQRRVQLTGGMLPVVGLCLLAGPAPALQTLVHEFRGRAAGDILGLSMASVGDVDGDGLGDVIVGARDADPNGWASGEAIVFSGADGSRLYTIAGQAPEDGVGTAVAGPGDVDNDGRPDFMVALVSGPNGHWSGSVRVHSGRT